MANCNWGKTARTGSSGDNSRKLLRLATIKVCCRKVQPWLSQGFCRFSRDRTLRYPTAQPWADPVREASTHNLGQAEDSCLAGSTAMLQQIDTTQLTEKQPLFLFDLLTKIWNHIQSSTSQLLFLDKQQLSRYRGRQAKPDRWPCLQKVILTLSVTDTILSPLELQLSAKLFEAARP